MVINNKLSVSVICLTLTFEPAYGGTRVDPTGIVLEGFAESLSHSYRRRMWHALCHYEQDDVQAHLAFPLFPPILDILETLTTGLP